MAQKLRWGDKEGRIAEWMGQGGKQDTLKFPAQALELQVPEPKKDTGLLRAEQEVGVAEAATKSFCHAAAEVHCKEHSKWIGKKQ